MILKPLQLLYSFGSEVKNNLYDRNWIKKVELDTPVISIGNLSVGGTGKTPCVYLIAQEFLKLEKYKKIAIISRSYKGSLKSAAAVDLSHPQATVIYGDEPCLLQEKLPQCRVWAGPKKYKTALLAVEKDKPDLILVDDGFSHRKLHRQFDLVLVDATAPLHYYQPLPVGRLREGMNQLRRAHAVLLTKTNLADEGKIRTLTKLILESSGLDKNKIYKAESKPVFDSLDPETQPVYAFCGLGQPSSFKRSLETLGFKILGFKEFPDHYAYSIQDLDTILKDFESQKSQKPQLKLVSTAKDIIKIKNHRILDFVHTFDYTMEIESQKKVELIENISRHF